MKISDLNSLYIHISAYIYMTTLYKPMSEDAVESATIFNNT